jgi:hypothetical protein
MYITHTPSNENTPDECLLHHLELVSAPVIHCEGCVCTFTPAEYIILAVGFANGIHCPHAGQYLESFDHDAFDGIGYGTFTDRVSHAKRFATASDALRFRNKQSTVKPLRQDGEPNRPLAALTVSIEPLP